MMHDSMSFIYISELIGLPIININNNKKIGSIVDIAATTTQVYPKVTGFIAKIKGEKPPVYIPWENVKKSAFKVSLVVDYSPEKQKINPKDIENEILLKKTFLDKQIISISGYKLVRVNDLQFLVESSSKEKPNLYLVHIDIGVKGLLRRMGFLRAVNSSYKWLFSHDIKDKFVPWKYVQPTVTTNVYGSLHLKLDASKLYDLHPADLADIIEDLGIDERISLIESLDHSTAAEAMQVIPLKIRVQIAETLDIEKLTGIINLMQIDEAVDFLDEMDPEQRGKIFTLLPLEKVDEIKELSQFSANTVGSIMNTDFVIANYRNTVEEVLNTVKAESEKAELIYYIYIVNDNEELIGTLTLRHLLSSKPSVPVSEIMSENIISVNGDTKIKKIAKIFFKYNFDAIPVIDENNKIQGIVTLRDALEFVFPEIEED
jgi:magnesium transporter